MRRWTSTRWDCSRAWRARRAISAAGCSSGLPPRASPSAELVKAVKENRLALLPVERVLGGTYTAGEVEERTGLPDGTIARIRRQQGLPAPGSDDRVFSDEDVEAAKSMKLFLDAGFADERVDEITRVLGEGMGRLSATIAASFVETFLEAGRERGRGGAALR